MHPSLNTPFIIILIVEVFLSKTVSPTPAALENVTIFFVTTVLLLSIYTGPSTAATQDVVPSVLRASAVAISLLIAHLLGDAWSPTFVGVLATNFDPTHGLRFEQSMAGQDLSQALLVTCTPALTIAGLVGILGAGWMKDDIAAAERADRIRNEV